MVYSTSLVQARSHFFFHFGHFLGKGIGGFGGLGGAWGMLWDALGCFGRLRGGFGKLWGGTGEALRRLGGGLGGLGKTSGPARPKIYIQTTDQPLLRPHII